MAEVSPKWTEEELSSDNVSKKDLVTYLQEISSIKFQQDHKLKGQLKNIAKTKSKDQLIADYKVLFEEKCFKKEGEDEEFAKAQSAKKVEDDLSAATKKMNVKSSEKTEEVPKYTKTIVKKGNKINFPLRGDTVTVYYTGKLANGTVFDTNMDKKKSGGYKNQPLKVKVGKGNLIKGWDEALLTMSYGEEADLIIEPDWAYGRRGIEGKIPPNATLHFHVKLMTIE